MQKLDLTQIALSERKTLYIVDDYTDRIVWKILNTDNSSCEYKIVAIDEFLNFVRNAPDQSSDGSKSNEFIPSAGDVLVWVDEKNGYAKLENFDAANLMAFHGYLVHTLKVKDLKLSCHKKDESKTDKTVEPSFRAKSKIPKIKKEMSAGVNVHYQSVEELVDEISHNFDSHGNENESSHINIQDEEDFLRKNGLFSQGSPYRYALELCVAKATGAYEYTCYHSSKEDISASIKIGANLADFLGVEAFANYHKILERKSTASCYIYINFDPAESDKEKKKQEKLK